MRINTTPTRLRRADDNESLSSFLNVRLDERDRSTAISQSVYPGKRRKNLRRRRLRVPHLL
jgi:hypothetical protein